jgi:hypothetical protein
MLCFRPKSPTMAAAAAIKMQALARWRHPLASSEVLVVLHRAMRPASHCRIRMVGEIFVNLPAFFVASISLLATTISYRPCYD